MAPQVGRDAAAASAKCKCVCCLCGRSFTVVQSREEAPAGREQSLQHYVLQVLLQYGVFDGVEDEADVLRVDGGGEVVEQRLAPVPPLAAERLHQERLPEGEIKGAGLSFSFRSHFLNMANARRDGVVAWR